MIASLRSQFQGAKNLSMILNGSDHTITVGLFCLQVKKAVDTSAEKRDITEVKARESRSSSSQKNSRTHTVESTSIR